MFLPDFILPCLKSLVFALVEGVTEWLPVSSTGHLLLLERFLPLGGSEAFRSFFLVWIQLGAILAVVVLYWPRLFPFRRPRPADALSAAGVDDRMGRCAWISRRTLRLWLNIVVASLPAAVVGILWGDALEAIFFRPAVVAAMLVLIGLWFLWVERPSARRTIRCDSVETLTLPLAWAIGCFQLLAAALPGTSRSGATILGALLLGVSRTAATEFTFFLGIPAMAGASLLKILHGGLAFSAQEWILLALGFLGAFLFSLPILRFLVRFVQTHSFRGFACYRIALGALVLILLQ